MPPTFGTSPSSCRRSWPAARTRSCARRKASRTTTRKARASINRLRPTKKDVVIGVSASGMTQFVRGALTRARTRRLEDHLRHLRSAHRAADVRRPDDRAGGRPGGDRRIDAAQGRHRDQDGPQHADDRRDGPHRQDLRQPDGRRADGLGEAARSRAPHHHRSSPASTTTRPTSCCGARTGTSRRRS